MSSTRKTLKAFKKAYGVTLYPMLKIWGVPRNVISREQTARMCEIFLQERSSISEMVTAIRSMLNQLALEIKLSKSKNIYYKKEIK